MAAKGYRPTSREIASTAERQAKELAARKREELRAETKASRVADAIACQADRARARADVRARCEARRLATKETTAEKRRRIRDEEREGIKLARVGLRQRGGPRSTSPESLAAFLAKARWEVAPGAELEWWKRGGGRQAWEAWRAKGARTSADVFAREYLTERADEIAEVDAELQERAAFREWEAYQRANPGPRSPRVGAGGGEARRAEGRKPLGGSSSCGREKPARRPNGPPVCGRHGCALFEGHPGPHVTRRELQAAFTRFHWGDRSPGPKETTAGDPREGCYELGVLASVSYIASKDGEVFEWVHRFNLRRPPILAATALTHRLVIAGGGYRVRKAGIVG